jgi:pseudaminic acid synthase
MTSPDRPDASTAGSVVSIGGRPIGRGEPTFVIAELSGNHNGSLARAMEIVDAVSESGADAVKLQTYTADSLTLDSGAPSFLIEGGTPWDGRRLHELYREAATPWDWMEPLFERARARGLQVFSTPFDQAAIDLLEGLNPPAHKVASFELVDLQLLRAVAETGRPIIASTGMASEREIDEAVTALRSSGADELVLLRCNSSYPAPAREMDLRSIADMARRWGVPIGLSDHTMSNTASIVAVTLGACVIEKHVTLSRADPGPDSSFSLEPDELRDLVTSVRETEASLGTVRYGPSPSEAASVVFRRSLFAVEEIAAGEQLTERNVRSIRPGAGLHPRHLPNVLGRRATQDMPPGTPLRWDLLED